MPFPVSGLLSSTGAGQGLHTRMTATGARVVRAGYACRCACAPGNARVCLAILKSARPAAFLALDPIASRSIQTGNPYRLWDWSPLNWRVGLVQHTVDATYELPARARHGRPMHPVVPNRKAPGRAGRLEIPQGLDQILLEVLAPPGLAAAELVPILHGQRVGLGVAARAAKLCHDGDRVRRRGAGPAP